MEIYLPDLPDTDFTLIPPKTIFYPPIVEEPYLDPLLLPSLEQIDSGLGGQESSAEEKKASSTEEVSGAKPETIPTNLPNTKETLSTEEAIATFNIPFFGEMPIPAPEVIASSVIAAGTASVARFGRPLSVGTSFDQYVDFKIGRHTAPGGAFQSFTRFDIDLRDDSTTTGNNTNIMTLLNNGNIGISQTSPTSNINSGTFFKPDSSGRFLTLNGANGSFIMLETSTTTDNDNAGGIYFTNTGGQSDAHKQIAGISCTYIKNTSNNALSGGQLEFFTKPNNAGSNTPRFTISQTGEVSVVSALEAGQTLFNTKNANVATPAEQFFIEHNGADVAIGNKRGAFAIENDLNIGVADGGERKLKIHGGATGTPEGGQIELHTAADHDSTYAFYRIDAYEDDLRIGRQGNTDILLNSSGNTTFSGNINLGDGKKANFGAGEYLQIQHNGTDSQITSIAGHLQFTNTSNDKDITFATDDGSGGDTEYFRIDGGAEKNIFSKPVELGDLTISGTLSGAGSFVPVGGGTFTGDVTISKAATPLFKLLDTTNNVNLLLGADDTNTFLRGSSGSLIFQTNGANAALTLDASQNSTFAGGINTEGNFINIGNGQSHSENYLQIGNSRTGNGFAYIDLIGDATYTDFGLRIIRGNTGANASSVIEHRGTGDFVIQATDAAALRLNTSNTERMRVSAGGNIGIGENNPSKKLVLNENDNECVIVIKSSDTGTAGIYMGDQSDEIVGGIIYDNNNDLLQLRSSNNNTAVSIDSSERVGIGTTSPAKPLHVIGEVRFDNDLTLQATRKIYLDGGNDTYITEVAANEIAFNTGGGERVRIDSSGQVGIGINSPSAPLNIAGSGADGNAMLKLEATAGSQNFNWVSSVVYPNLAVDKTIIKLFGKEQALNNQAYIGFKYAGDNSTSNQLTFGFYGNDFLVNLLANGNLGIGTESPTAKLHSVANSSTTVPLKLRQHASTTVESILSITNKAAGTDFYHFVGQTDAATSAVNRIIIYGNGNIQNSNNSYGQISDENLKENIVDATPKLEDIKKLKVKNFNYKGEDYKQIGMIAQDVEKIFPSLVEEVTDPETKEKHKSLKYSVFVPMLIKSIQELEKRVQELENK